MSVLERRYDRIILINPDLAVGKMYQRSLARRPNLGPGGVMVVGSLDEGVRAILTAVQERKPFSLAVVDADALGPPGKPNQALLDLLKPSGVSHPLQLLITGPLAQRPFFGQTPFFDFFSVSNGVSEFVRVVSQLLGRDK